MKYHTYDEMAEADFFDDMEDIPWAISVSSVADGGPVTKFDQRIMFCLFRTNKDSIEKTAEAHSESVWFNDDPEHDACVYTVANIDSEGHHLDNTVQLAYSVNDEWTLIAECQGDYANEMELRQLGKMIYEVISPEDQG